MNFQTGSDYPIEIWQVSNPNFSPTVLINFQTGSDYPIEIWQVSNPNFSPTEWMNFQTGFDYPIAIWQSVKSQLFPDRLDEFPNQIRLPNCDLTSVKSQFFPNRLDDFPNRVWLPNCELTKCQITIFPWQFGWISKPGLITQLRFDQVSNHIFSPTAWMNFQTGSDYPIAIWRNVKSHFFPDHLDEFPHWVWLPNCDLMQCQITIFPRQFGRISKLGLIAQLRFD